MSPVHTAFHNILKSGIIHLVQSGPTLKFGVSATPCCIRTLISGKVASRLWHNRGVGPGGTGAQATMAALTLASSSPLKIFNASSLTRCSLDCFLKRALS